VIDMGFPFSLSTHFLAKPLIIFIQISRQNKNKTKRIQRYWSSKHLFVIKNFEVMSILMKSTPLNETIMIIA